MHTLLDALKIDEFAALLKIAGHNVWVLNQMGPDYAVEIAPFGATTPGELEPFATLGAIETELAARYLNYSVGSAVWEPAGE